MTMMATSDHDDHERRDKRDCNSGDVRATFLRCSLQNWISKNNFRELSENVAVIDVVVVVVLRCA